VSALIDAMLAAQAVTTLVLAGFVVVLFAVIVTVLRGRATRRHLEQTLALIEKNRIQEARIHARGAGSAAMPLVVALSSEPTIPSQASSLSALLWATISVLPVVALVTFGVTVMTETTNAHTIPTATAIMIGLSVLIPSSVLGCVTIAHVSARSTRWVRSICIQAVAATLPTPEEERSTVQPSLLAEDNQ
jgi:hypothetical protein